jgi:acetoin utilization deacetylase AcuC-like enzyme
MNVTTPGFAKMTRIIKSISDDFCPHHLVFTLEGGYHRQALAFSVTATFDILMGSNEIFDPLGAPRLVYSPQNFGDFVKRIRSIHKLKD